MWYFTQEPKEKPYIDQRPGRKPYMVAATCNFCGEQVEAWCTYRRSYSDGELIYQCDCPTCGTRREARAIK